MPVLLGIGITEILDFSSKPKQDAPCFVLVEVSEVTSDCSQIKFNGESNRTMVIEEGMKQNNARVCEGG